MAVRSLIPGAIGATIEAALIFYKIDSVAPIAGFTTTAISNYLCERLERAQNILRSELERAGVTAKDFRDADQLAAAALRYHRAARDQAMDENLRILAQAMVGLARRDELWASDFLKYAEILAPLSRDELILIGRMMAEDAQLATPPPPGSPGLWKVLKTSGLFPSEEYLAAVATRAQRSGLICPITGWGERITSLPLSVVRCAQSLIFQPCSEAIKRPACGSLRRPPPGLHLASRPLFLLEFARSRIIAHYDKFLKVLKKSSIHLSSILDPPLGFNLALG